MKNIANTFVGICLGASTVSLVEMEEIGAKRTIVSTITQAHLGNVRNCLLDILGRHNHLFHAKFCVTGRKLRHALYLSSIAEAEAVELAMHYILPTDHPYRVVISAGGETFIVYHLAASGFIEHIQAGNKCASGTGEFFLQQLHRMDLSLGDIAGLRVSEKPYKVSARCSVFCKSDCTHALNKGVPKTSVISGLTAMMADKLDELLGKLPRDNAILIGGCADNTGMVHYLRQKVDTLFIPDEAPYMEALGAACWAVEHKTRPFPGLSELFRDDIDHFSLHRPLADFNHLVHFKQCPHSLAREGDRVILGLDVGSTSTKGVIMRRQDKAILASSYLRTNGDPVAASRKVYASLASQLNAALVIEGLGITGSGRQIAGLHANATAVINEIIAHATAAAHFDPMVDTIFEIGGQDAKYTFLANGVPNDYAMNEACSAGTGSFLEESAKESLGIGVEDIGEIAFRGFTPPNFNDQCAAFISSDIKSAVHQNISTEDIVAGLVYSICLNYINRVVGNRPIGKKIFVQGGVCYNSAVPAAMAALTGKEVIVPPNPGLMGAFGAALEIDKRLAQGLLHGSGFTLDVLAAREISPVESFVCAGGMEKCDHKCTIALFKIDGKNYPFGGICNRYDNLVHNKKINTGELNLVAARQRLVFGDRTLVPDTTRLETTVRINRSFLLNTYYPFYKAFFSALGCRIILPECIDAKGVSQRGSSFCFPAEIAHGYAADMLTKPADFTFMPHIKGLPSTDNEVACTCVFVQSEPYYLRATFAELDSPTTLSPVIDFSKDAREIRKVFAGIADQLGRSRRQGERAFDLAQTAQEDFRRELRQQGQKLLQELERNPNEIAIVLFGRPYNAFAQEVNKGIPLKFASRTIRIIPFDMLAFAEEELALENNMYWGMGKMLLQCAQLVARHPQLFGTYITNFSCGPDSFLITYFRDIMQGKPSLTLELDSHTADAGIETRIEAFLDIIQSFRKQNRPNVFAGSRTTFTPAKIVSRNGQSFMHTSGGEYVPLTDQRVRLLIPPMGRFASPLLAKAFAGSGIRADVLPAADEKVLKLGKDNSSCKECLPLQTTLGSILNYLKNDRPDGELTVYFMPSAPGPCRFGQYNVFTKRVVQQHEFDDIAVFSPHSANCYGGLGGQSASVALRAIVIGDLFDEMRATLLTAATDTVSALATLSHYYDAILGCIDGRWAGVKKVLQECAEGLGRIPLVRPYEEIPKISLVGEIYVRHDPISLQHLVERMAKRGFIVRTAQTSEWLKYLDWLIKNKILGKRSLSFWLRHFVKERTDKHIRQLLAPSGLFYNGDMGVDAVVNSARKFISPALQGETILTVGAAFHEILNPACGVISLGPFGCMPNRVAEAILKEKFGSREKRAQLHGQPLMALPLEGDRKFPFLAIETDGNPFPQIIEARLESFCLQAERLHQEMVNDLLLQTGRLKN